MQTQTFKPEDVFSANLLSSIPRKVVHWLLFLGQELSEPFMFGRLVVEYSPEGGRLTLGKTGDEDFCQIFWRGDCLYATAQLDISTDSVAVTRRATMLESFIPLELAIYDQIECFQAEIAQRPIEQTTPRHG